MADAAPETSAQSADAKAASGSAGGTTVSIQVYRSSFPIVKWDLNDDDFSLTKAAWAGKPANAADLPQRGTPGQAIEWTAPSGYAEPTRAGFEFAGWSTDKSAPAGGFLNASPAITMPDGAPAGGEYTLYALWTPNEYSVIFELGKNPDVGDGPGSDASFDLKWDTADGVRTVSDLGSGRFRVDGFTMKESDYDKATRTVGLPEPSRTGYRFLGWAEPDGQALAIDNAAKDGYALNPVRLTQIDGIPVLTARWASAFGVTAPLSITFGDYDKTGAPGNPSLGESSSSAASDTTQSEADDVETAGLTDQGRYEAAGQAYFENTGWNDAIRMVAVTSERDPSANQVLTTYDSSKASEAQVLGDGTAANPGERLLSLYPAASAPADKATGIHFRLSDSLSEADLVQLPSIAAHAKQPVTYGLNLSTDPVTGAANHGLVLETEDYEPKQIATVSYTFATADAASEEPHPHGGATGSVNDDIYIEYDGKVYGTADILHAANCISSLGTASPCYPLYSQIMHAQGMPSKGLIPADAQAKVYAKYSGPEATASQPNCKRAGYVRLLILGLNHDALEVVPGAYDGRKGSAQVTKRAGITFQFMDAVGKAPINPTATNAGGWGGCAMRNSTLGPSGAIARNLAIYDKVKPTYRFSNNRGGGVSTSTNVIPWKDMVSTTQEKLFLLSFIEVWDIWGLPGSQHDPGREDEWMNYEGYQYEYWREVCGEWRHPTATGPSDQNLGVLAKLGMDGSDTVWWLRTMGVSSTSNADAVNNRTDSPPGSNAGNGVRQSASTQSYVVPCFCL